MVQTASALIRERKDNDMNLVYVKLHINQFMLSHTL